MDDGSSFQELPDIELRARLEGVRAAEQTLVPQGNPRVDGKRELEWDLLPMTKVEPGAGPAFSFQLRWDADNLYVLAEVADSTRDAEDSVEIFVDDNQRQDSRPPTR